jgi:hypothetical protein
MSEVHRLTAVSLVVRHEKKRRRQRKVTLARALREAAKAGLSMTGAVIEDDKVTLTFGPGPTEAANPWLAEIEKQTRQ